MMRNNQIKYVIMQMFLTMSTYFLCLLMVQKASAANPDCLNRELQAPQSDVYQHCVCP